VKGNKSALVAASSILLLLPGLIPGIGPFLTAIVPGLSFGLLYGIEDHRGLYLILVAVTVLGLVLGVLVGNPGLGVLTLQTAGMVFMLGVGHKYSWNGPQMMLACFFFLAWTFILSIILLVGPTEIEEWYSKFIEALTKEMEITFSQYINNAQGKNTEQWFAHWKQGLFNLFPAFLGFSLLMISYLNVLICGAVTQRLWGQRVFGPSFENWKLPDALVWLVIIFGSAALFTKGFYYKVGLNGIYVIGAFYLIQGLAVIHFMIKRMGMPWFIKTIFYVLILIQWYGLLIVTLIGLADVWFDFRSKLQKNSADQQD